MPSQFCFPRHCLKTPLFVSTSTGKLATFFDAPSLGSIPGSVRISPSVVFVPLGTPVYIYVPHECARLALSEDAETLYLSTGCAYMTFNVQSGVIDSSLIAMSPTPFSLATSPSGVLFAPEASPSSCAFCTALLVLFAHGNSVLRFDSFIISAAQKTVADETKKTPFDLSRLDWKLVFGSTEDAGDAGYVKAENRP